MFLSRRVRLLFILFCGIVAHCHSACIGYSDPLLPTTCIDGYWTAQTSVIVGATTTLEPGTIALQSLKIEYPTRIVGNLSIVKQGALTLAPPLSDNRYDSSTTALLKVDNCVLSNSLPPNVSLTGDDAYWLAKRFSPYYVAGIATDCSTWDLGNEWNSMFPNNLQTTTYPKYVCELIQNRYQATTSNVKWLLNLIFKHAYDSTRCPSPINPTATPAQKRKLSTTTIIIIVAFSIITPLTLIWGFWSCCLRDLLSSIYSFLTSCFSKCCATSDEEEALIPPPLPGTTAAALSAAGAVPPPLPLAPDSLKADKKKKKKKKKDADDPANYTPLQDWTQDGPNDGSAAAFVSYEAGRY